MVAKACGVENATRYLPHGRFEKSLSNRWNYRSQIRIEAKTAKYSQAIANKAIEAGLSGYVVVVKGHVLLLNKHREVHVDTAPEYTARKSPSNLWPVLQT